MEDEFDIDYKGTALAKTITFVAPYSATYDIITFDRISGDPYLELYDVNHKKLQYNDDGNGDRNAKITYSFVEGERYYIVVRGFNDKVETQFKVGVHFSHSNSSVLSLGNKTLTMYDNRVRVFKFTAPSAGRYNIYTISKGSGDPYLALMDSNGQYLAMSDDVAKSCDASITFRATKSGEIFYLVVREWSEKNTSMSIVAKKLS